MVIERLTPDESSALVHQFIQAFNENQLWPQDAACVIADCRPTDEQLLTLLQDNRVRCQKLGLHILAQLIGTINFDQQTHKTVAQAVLRLLRTEIFRPKLKDLAELKLWSESNTVGLNETNRPTS